MPLIDLTGKKLGSLTIIERDYEYGKKTNMKKPPVYWKWVCDCGRTGTSSSYNLRHSPNPRCEHCRSGFKDLTHEWDRTNHIENFNQIDSYGYLLNAWMKFPKYGHAYATDYSARWVRYGLLTREEAVKLAEERDHNLDPKIVEDFCNFTGMTIKEFYEALDKLYNKDIFEQNSWGQWRLKKENIEERRYPKWED